MSFQQLNKDVLEIVGEEFAVDWTKENPTKAQMIKDLDEEGVTWAMYKAAFPDPEDEDETPALDADDADDELDPDEAPATKKFTRAPKQVLVKMTRQNGTYQIRGYNFTKTHPFLPVSAEDADFLVEVIGGFKIAGPREVEEYYS